MIEGKTASGIISKLRYGMIGGGPGSFIGEVHRKAMAMDGKAELVCGCFSQIYDQTLAQGKQLGLSQERLYPDFEMMIEAESSRPDRPHFIVIVAPNNIHYPAARLALEHGFNVACEKPLTTNSEQARELVRLVKEKDLMFSVAYAYSASPIVKQIRHLITSGEIGEVRFVSAEYSQEWLATLLERTGQKQALWRTDPKYAGLSNCVGDIGSHIEHMVSHMTGLKIKSLCARLDIFGKDRVIDDNATVLVNYEGGARGVYWSSQIAIGHDNDFRVRIYGTKGAIEWFQEDPNNARLSYLDKPKAIISRARDPMSARAQQLSRLPAGHPEGYFECFANLYSTFIDALAKKMDNQPLSEDDLDFPDVEDGRRGVAYIEKCVESSKRGSVWLDFE